MRVTRKTQLETRKRLLAAARVEFTARGFAAATTRDIARRAGISPSTAHRFKIGKVIDVPTAHKLIAARLIAVCPCCGTSIKANGGGE